tara:strand:+ start:69 stop:875 length:807 start_codon:yes stop_codon:yes gene_type:complete
MKTQDLFKTKAEKVNESIHKAFGKKIDFSTFDAPKLEDARNKLRTQLHQAKSTSKFNENLENDAYHEAQWMLDAINKELEEREDAAINGLEIAEETPENSGEEMETKVTEGEIQQASAIVTAKTMVDRLSRFIEEISSMENETLLQLGDSIRDEIGQAESKQFIESSAPAISAALENLKTTRETLSSAVGVLAGEETSSDMLGAEPEEGGATDMAEPAADAGADAGAEAPAGDDFAAAEPAAGGMETAGREQRESINYESRLLKTLAG